MANRKKPTPARPAAVRASAGRNTPKSINLALQGGGSHGAFTWGVVDYLLEDGASPYEIDAAVRGFGFAMGPFQVTDLAGGDIGWATRKRRAANLRCNRRAKVSELP